MTNPPGSGGQRSITWFLTTTSLFIPSFLLPPLVFDSSRVFNCDNASLFSSIFLLPSVSYSFPSSTILPSCAQLLITAQLPVLHFSPSCIALSFFWIQSLLFFFFCQLHLFWHIYPTSSFSAASFRSILKIMFWILHLTSTCSFYHHIFCPQNDFSIQCTGTHPGCLCVQYIYSGVRVKNQK